MAKKFKTEKEKIEIVKQAKIDGDVVTARKYSVGYSSLMRWKQQYAAGGEQKIVSARNITDSDYNAILRENRRLKELVADKELKIKIQEELLKKNR